MSFASSPSSPISVGLIGFGAFGRLIARHLCAHCPIRAYDPLIAPGTDETDAEIVTLGVAAACSVVILAAPVSHLAEVVSAIGPHLRPGTLVLDVGSVKVIAARIMVEGLPEHVDIVATHPLFGPQSAR